MKRSLTALLCWVAAAAAGQLRPPAYPLITHDPYLSVWSFTDQLNASPTVHWTGKPQNLDGLLRVDGTTYRFLGGEVPRYAPVLPTALKQPYTARFTAEKPCLLYTSPSPRD